MSDDPTNGLKTKFFRAAKAAVQRSRSIYWRARVTRILRRPGSPVTLRAEKDFERLQSEYHKLPPPYGYDALSNWQRGVDRASWILHNLSLPDKGARILEAGCGDGMCGYALATYGHRVTLSDMDDWRDERAKPLEFLAGRLEDGLNTPENFFDLAVSFNAFEHYADPALCLQRILRACKPGGIILVDFGPLYCTATGLHCHRALRMPFPQFLFSAEFVRQKIQQIKNEDLGKKTDNLQPLNQWRPGRFRDLWRAEGYDIVSEDEFRTLAGLEIVLRYPEAFCGRGLDWDDLTIVRLRAVLRKRKN